MSVSEAFVGPWTPAEKDGARSAPRGAPHELLSLVDEQTRHILAARSRSPLAARRGWLMRRALLAADLLGLTASFGLAEAFAAHGGTSAFLSAETLVFVCSLPLWVVVAKLYGLYDRDEERTDHSTADDVLGVFHLVTVGSWIVFASSWVTKVARPDLGKIALFWVLAIGAIGIARASARAICRRHVSYLQNTVIVGAGDVGQSIARKILQHSEYGINVVGFIDDQPKERRPGIEHLTLLGGIDELQEVVELLDVERVVIAFTNDSTDVILDAIRQLGDRDVQIDIVPRFFDLVGPGMGMHTVEGLPLIGLPSLRLSRSSRLLKRVMDVLCAGLGLALLAVPFLVLALLIKLDSPGPVFFRQVRMGSRGTFRIWKFRTMTADADARKSEYVHLNKYAEPGGDPRMFKIANDPRVTRLGRWLRRHSMDELPQLINVLLGDMSLVGPRPLILEEDRHIADWARKRLALKPGITGVWQVTGRNEIPLDEMVRLDYLYVSGWSLLDDLRLILRTVPVLLRPSTG